MLNPIRLCSLLAVLLIGSTATAQTIQVSASGDDVVLVCPSVFQLRFDKSQGGNITQYYDLATDPGATINLAAAGGSLYDGLYFIMFKQETPELWTANFQAGADTIEIIDEQPQMVKIRVRGDFPDGGFGLPASYEFFYTITANAEIYIRSRVTFNQAFTRQMQIRQALGLTTTYATTTGWIEFSQDQDLVPYYYQGGGDDDYLGARIDTSGAAVDPILILHQDWNIADYILLIAPTVADECLIAWVSNRNHFFAAGEVIENKLLLAMNQLSIGSHAGPAAVASAYRAGTGGDFSDQPGAPQAAAVVTPTSGTAPLTVSFDASGSQDADGIITTYAWDFGDGTTGSGVTTSHTYFHPNTFSVTLTVTDDTGLWGTASGIVRVEGPRVIVDNSDGAPSFTSQGTWVTSDVQPGFYGPNYAINDAGNGGDWARWQPDLPNAGPYRVFASWSTDADRPTDATFAVHHRDGVQLVSMNMRVTDVSGWNVIGEFEFEASGDEYVELTDDTSTGSEVIADAVMFEYLGENVTPMAQLQADPLIGPVPLMVTFDASGSTDPDGTIVAYHWDFGDNETATEAAPSHVFAAAGSFEVTLTVTDNEGAIDTKGVTIQAQGPDDLDAGGSEPTDGGDGGAGGEVSATGCSCGSAGLSQTPWLFALFLLAMLGIRLESLANR